RRHEAGATLDAARGRDEVGARRPDVVHEGRAYALGSWRAHRKAAFACASRPAASKQRRRRLMARVAVLEDLVAIRIESQLTRTSAKGGAVQRDLLVRRGPAVAGFARGPRVLDRDGRRFAPQRLRGVAAAVLA